MTEPHVVERASGIWSDYTLFSDRVVFVRLRDGIAIDGIVGERGMAELQEFVGEGPHLVVVDGRQMGYIKPEGRIAVHDSISADRIATAPVAGTDVTDFLARKFLEACPGRIETRVFSDEATAMAWAHATMADEQQRAAGS